MERYMSVNLATQGIKKKSICIFVQIASIFNREILELIIILVFVAGYVCIAFEHPLKVNKTASALLTGGLCCTLFIIAEPLQAVMEGKEFVGFVKGLKTALGP